MSALSFKVLDLDFPAGSKNKTATLVTGDSEALLVDAAFTRADGHRLPAEILDSGKKLTTVFVSHADPDFYFGAEVIADAFPDAVFVATPIVIDHIQHSYEGKLEAWATLGTNLPTRLVNLTPLTGDLTLEDHRFELKGGPAALPDRHYLWQAEHRTLLGGVLLFQQEHVWVADTPTPGDRAAWIDLLDEMTALDPQLVVPGHRLPATPADPSAITATRDYLLAFEEELGKAADGAALTEALIRRYPDNGMLIAAQIGAKVAKGEIEVGLNMSEFAAPADVVRRQYLASAAASDLAALRATLAPDVEWTEMAGFPLAGTYRTPDGVTADVMEKLGQDWDGWTAHDDTYVADGENVVVLARYTAVNKTTGKPLDVRVAHHFVVRGGLIVRFEQFVDTALVRDAASV